MICNNSWISQRHLVTLPTLEIYFQDIYLYSRDLSTQIPIQSHNCWSFSTLAAITLTGLGDQSRDQMAGKDREYRKEVSPKRRGQVVTDGEWGSVTGTQHQEIGGWNYWGNLCMIPETISAPLLEKHVVVWGEKPVCLWKVTQHRGRSTSSGDRWFGGRFQFSTY